MNYGPRLISLLALAATAAAGCGTAPVRTSQPVAEATLVKLAVVSPDGGTVTSAGNITVRGTVTPPDASVVVQGRPASVRNGVFTGQARLHRGRTTIDVIASARGATAGATSVTVRRRSPKPAPTPAPVRATAAVAPATTTVLVREAAPSGGGCGAGVSVGADTSCPFARNVRDAYYAQGAGTVSAYSPVTGRTYAMYCRGTSPVVCTGGNNATVYIDAPARRSAPASGGTCAPGVTAGPNTSCPFATEVRDAYFAQGPGTVIAYSPVTQRTYRMYCRGTAPVVCTGGNNASVYINS